MKLQLAFKQGQIVTIEIVQDDTKLPPDNNALGLYFEQYGYDCEEILTGDCAFFYFEDDYFLKCDYRIKMNAYTDVLECPSGYTEHQECVELDSFTWGKSILYKADEPIWEGYVGGLEFFQDKVEEEEIQDELDR